MKSLFTTYNEIEGERILRRGSEPAAALANGVEMEERDFFNEKNEVIPAEIYCPKCRTSMQYEVRWLRRTKKTSLPPRADDQDRARFAKARSYRVRLDDKLRCKNPRCGKTIEITSLQTVVFDQ